jgi:hypothetical protein
MPEIRTIYLADASVQELRRLIPELETWANTLPEISGGLLRRAAHYLRALQCLIPDREETP